MPAEEVEPAEQELEVGRKILGPAQHPPPCARRAPLERRNAPIFTQRAEERFRRHRLVELASVTIFFSSRTVAHPHAARDRFLEDLGRLGVADLRSEGRHDGGRLLEVVSALLRVGRDAVDAARPDDRQEVEEELRPAGQVVGEQRHHDVQVELAAADGELVGRVEADHLEAQHVQALEERRVDLAGHDRGAGLHRRQPDLVEAGRGPGGEQAQVVGDPRELHGERTERRGVVARRRAALQALAGVGRRDEALAGRARRAVAIAFSRKPGRRVQARARRRAAQGELAQSVERARRAPPSGARGRSRRRGTPGRA